MKKMEASNKFEHTTYPNDDMVLENLKQNQAAPLPQATSTPDVKPKVKNQLLDNLPPRTSAVVLPPNPHIHSQISQTQNPSPIPIMPTGFPASPGFAPNTTMGGPTFNPKIDSFDGLTPIKPFIFQYELLSQGYGWGYAKMAAQLPLFLKREALAWYASNIVAGGSWDSVKAELLSAFGREATYEVSFQKFANLVPKGNQTLQAFVTELLKLARQVAAPDKLMIVAKVIPYLPEHLKALVLMRNPHTSSALVEVLRPHYHIVLSQPSLMVAAVQGDGARPRQQLQEQSRPHFRPQSKPQFRQQYQTNRGKECPRCGWKRCEGGQKCRAYGLECRACKKLNHFERCCRSNARQEGNQR